MFFVEDWLGAGAQLVERVESPAPAGPSRRRSSCEVDRARGYLSELPEVVRSADDFYARLDAVFGMTPEQERDAALYGTDDGGLRGNRLTGLLLVPVVLALAGYARLRDRRR